MTSVKQEIPTINIPNDIENKSISSTSSETKENEYLSSSSTSSISFEDKKVINDNSMATTNTNAIKNTPLQRQLSEDKQKKNEKRTKRNSFKRIKEEGEVFVKSLFGKEKSNNKKQNSVPPSPRTKYRKSLRGNDGDQQKSNTFPLSDDDNLKTKARNRLSINLSDFMKSDNDKQEKEIEKRRRTFHFTDSHNDLDFAVDNIDNDSSPDLKHVTTIKTNFNPILSTAQYDSPIVENLPISSALSSTMNTSNKDEKTIVQDDNLITPVQNLVIKEEEKEEINEQKINETREIITPFITSTTSDEENEDDEDDEDEDEEGDLANNNNNNSNNNNNNNNNNRDDVDDNNDDDVVVQKFRRTSNVSNDTEISDDIEILNTTINANTNITTTAKNDSNDQEKPTITAIVNNIPPEISSVNSLQNIPSNKVVETSSSSNNNVDDSQTLNIIEEYQAPKMIYKVPEFRYSMHDNEDNEIDKNDRQQNDEKLMIVMTGEATNNNKKIDIKNENKVDRINTLETIVLRQLDLAEKMQETMTRLESKVNEQKEGSFVPSQMEDIIRKLENKINERDAELDGLKTIVGKLQENQQMMIANEAYNNRDLETIHRELALFSQTSSTTFSLTPQNLHQQQHQVYTRSTLVDTLVVRPLCNTITISASIATSVMYAVYVRPAVGLFKILTR